MPLTPTLLPDLIQSIDNIIEANADEVTALDQAIGDGDHVTNIQRGIKALMAETNELAQLDWAAAWQKIGMTLMSAVGGASGSLFGTLFVAMSNAARLHSEQNSTIDLTQFAMIFASGVDAVKQRGKADAGEKTMLDVLIPVAAYLQQAAQDSIALSVVLDSVAKTAVTGMESTKEMIATKGRASFLEERSKGYIDAGAKTSQLMICAIVTLLQANLTSPT